MRQLLAVWLRRLADWLDGGIPCVLTGKDAEAFERRMAEARPVPEEAERATEALGRFRIGG